MSVGGLSFLNWLRSFLVLLLSSRLVLKILGLSLLKEVKDDPDAENEPVDVKAEEAGQQEAEDRLHVGTHHIHLQLHSRHVDAPGQHQQASVEPEYECDDEGDGGEEAVLGL